MENQINFEYEKFKKQYQEQEITPKDIKQPIEIMKPYNNIKLTYINDSKDE